MKKLLLLSLLITSTAYSQKYESTVLVARTSLKETSMISQGTKPQWFFEIRGDTIIKEPGKYETYYLNNVKETFDNGKIEVLAEFIENNKTWTGQRNPNQSVINIYIVNNFTGIKRWNQFRVRLSKKQ